MSKFISLIRFANRLFTLQFTMPDERVVTTVEPYLPTPEERVKSLRRCESKVLEGKHFTRVSYGVANPANVGKIYEVCTSSPGCFKNRDGSMSKITLAAVQMSASNRNQMLAEIADLNPPPFVTRASSSRSPARASLTTPNTHSRSMPATPSSPSPFKRVTRSARKRKAAVPVAAAPPSTTLESSQCLDLSASLVSTSGLSETLDPSSDDLFPSASQLNASDITIPTLPNSSQDSLFSSSDASYFPSGSLLNTLDIVMSTLPSSSQDSLFSPSDTSDIPSASQYSASPLDISDETSDFTVSSIPSSSQVSTSTTIESSSVSSVCQSKSPALNITDEISDFTMSLLPNSSQESTSDSSNYLPVSELSVPQSVPKALASETLPSALPTSSQANESPNPNETSLPQEPVTPGYNAEALRLRLRRRAHTLTYTHKVLGKRARGSPIRKPADASGSSADPIVIDSSDEDEPMAKRAKGKKQDNQTALSSWYSSVPVDVIEIED